MLYLGYTRAMLYFILFFGFGLIVGSFLNVVLLRGERDMSLKRYIIIPSNNLLAC